VTDIVAHPGSLDPRSKRILFAWIACDIAWVLLFVDARNRHARRLGLR
jgi:hypothetical protein